MFEHMTEFALAALWTAAFFSAVTVVGDYEATRQMTHDDFRWVPLVRLMRRARGLAAVAVLALVVLSLIATPLLSVMLVLLTFLFSMTHQSRRLACGDTFNAIFGGFVPSYALIFTLANVIKLPFGNLAGLELGMVATVPALIVVASLVTATHYRDEQGLLKLRD